MKARTGDPEFARHFNRALVLNVLRTQRSRSRSDLSRDLQLSKVTISAVVNGLLAEKIVVEDGERASSAQGGRKPILLSLNPGSNCVVGVDIGATQIRGAVSTLRGELIARARRTTAKSRCLKSVVSQVGAMVGDLLRQAEVGGSCVLGLGISAAGIVEGQSGLIKFSPDFGWREVNLADSIRQATSLEVIVDNCTRAMALGERWFGNARGVRNALYVSVGYGLGSALILNNQIYDHHSEFGHLHVTDDRVRCDCGKFGCLEAVCSGRAIEEAAKSAYQKRNGKWLTARELAGMAEAGDAGARALFVAAGTHLGRALSLAANLFNPEKIIVGGGVSLAGKLLLEPLRKEFEAHAMEVIRVGTAIELSALGADAALYGAVSLALNRFVFVPEVINQ